MASDFVQHDGCVSDAFLSLRRVDVRYCSHTDVTGVDEDSPFEDLLSARQKDIFDKFDISSDHPLRDMPIRTLRVTFHKGPAQFSQLLQKKKIFDEEAQDYISDLAREIFSEYGVCAQ